MNMKYATVYAKRNFYKMRYETNKMKRNEIYKIYFFFEQISRNSKCKLQNFNQI